MKLLTIIPLLIILAIGCSRSKSGKTTSNDRKPDRVKESVSAERSNESLSDTSSIYKMTFKRDGSYGSTGKIIVGKIATFTVDNQNRVFIADEDQTTVHVFNPDGSYLTSIGRKGHGPGEFAAITSKTTMKIHSNKLYVTDSAGFFPMRLQIFSLDDFSFLQTVKLIPDNRNSYPNLKGYYPEQFYPLNKGTFLVSYHRLPFYYKDKKSFIRYMILDAKGNIIAGPILVQKDLTNLVYKVPSLRVRYSIIHSFLFFGKSLFVLSDDDHLYAANNTEKFKISVYDTSGKLIRTFQHPYKDKALTRNGLIDRYKTIDMSRLDYRKGAHVALKMIRNARNLPDTWPALESMFFDNENRLWISTCTKDDSVYEWWILKKSGKVVAKFK